MADDSSLSRARRIVAQPTVAVSPNTFFSMPVVLAVSRDGAGIFANWNSQPQLCAALWGLIALLAVVAILSVLYRRHQAATHTRKAETRAALQRADERLQAVAKLASIGLWEYEPINDTISWDASMLAILGFEAATFATTTEAMACCLIEPDRAQARTDLDRTAETGVPLDGVYSIVRRDGARRDIHVRARREILADGTARVTGTIEDITERLNIAAALREAQELFRAAFEAAAIGQALIHRSGRFIQVNSAMAAITGYNVEELKTLTFQELEHPDDQDVNVHPIAE